jgi:hypothetical protein
MADKRVQVMLYNAPALTSQHELSYTQLTKLLMMSTTPAVTFSCTGEIPPSKLEDKM